MKEQLIGAAAIAAVGIVMLAVIYFESSLCHPGGSFLCDVARGFVNLIAPRTF